MSLKNILLLGDPRLYELSVAVKKEELDEIKYAIDILHRALMEYKEKYKAGRAIAAPQIGVMKRFIYVNIDKPIVIINPVLFDFSEEKIILWDDCFSFPNLFVKVERAKKVKMTFRDMNWEEYTWQLEDDLSELIQHEYDHLDGILATQRAIDNKSFKMIGS
ncbi:MAG: peptide deformylase [Bacteroidetes bacterium]|nr:peptide deformylase [Bacteroidota bacterium]